MAGNPRSFAIITTTVLLSSFAGIAAQAQHGGHGGGGSMPTDSASPVREPYLAKLRPNDNGEVIFRKPTQVGPLWFTPGTYRFEHVVVDDAHAIVFTNLDLSTAERPVAHRVPCKLEGLRKPAKKTEVYVIVGTELQRVERIQFQGEAAKHVLGPLG